MISIWNRRSIKCAFNLIVKIRSGSVIPPVLVFPLPIYVHHTLRPDYPPFNWRDGLGYVLNVFCFRLGAIDCLNKAHCLWNPSIAYFQVSWSTSSWLTNLTSLKSLLTVRSVVLLVSSIQTNFLIWFDLSGSAVKPGAYVLIILLLVVWMNFVWFFLLLLTLFRSYLLSCLLKFDGAIFFLSVLFVRSDSDCQPASLKNVKPTPVHYFTLDAMWDFLGAVHYRYTIHLTSHPPDWWRHLFWFFPTSQQNPKCFFLQHSAASCCSK